MRKAAALNNLPIDSVIEMPVTLTRKWNLDEVVAAAQTAPNILHAP